MVDMTVTTGEQAVSAPEARRKIPADTFANRLILARAFAGHLSIRDAAERCKGFGVRMGHGAWANWEKGAMPMDRLATVEVISEQLDVDADWLLNGGPLVQHKPRVRWRREDSEPTVTKRRVGPYAGITHPSGRVDLVRTSPLRAPTSRAAA